MFYLSLSFPEAFLSAWKLRLQMLDKKCRFQYLLLIFLISASTIEVAPQNGISTENFEPEYLTGYQLTQEETDAYFSMHRTSPTSGASFQTLKSRTATSSSIQKRSPWSEDTCRSQNEYRAFYGNVLPDTLYRLRFARCIIPFTNPWYLTVCDVRHYNRRTGLPETRNPVHLLYHCPANHVCVPGARFERSFQYVRAWKADILCVPFTVFPKPLFIPPSKYRGAISCTPEIKIPGGGSSTDPAKPRITIPPGGLTYMLSESIEISGGGEYIATKMYIDDISSHLFKNWHRGEVSGTNETAAEAIVFPGLPRTVKFCAEVPSGRTEWLALHYGAFDVTSIRQRN